MDWFDSKPRFHYMEELMHIDVRVKSDSIRTGACPAVHVVQVRIVVEKLDSDVDVPPRTPRAWNLERAHSAMLREWTGAPPEQKHNV